MIVLTDNMGAAVSTRIVRWSQRPDDSDLMSSRDMSSARRLRETVVNAAARESIHQATR